MIGCIVLCGMVGRWIAPNNLIDIHGRPLIEYQLSFIENFENIDRIILAVQSYNIEVVREYIKNRYNRKEIEISVEEVPLGTGGAIKRALDLVDKDLVLVCNYNDFVNLDVYGLERFAREVSKHVVCVKSSFVCPYGIFLEDGFKEKPIIHEETNIGWYIFRTKDIKEVFSGLPEKFSLERLVLEKNLIEYAKYDIGEGVIWRPVHSRKDIEEISEILSRRFK